MFCNFYYFSWTNCVFGVNFFIEDAFWVPACLTCLVFLECANYKSWNWDNAALYVEHSFLKSEKFLQNNKLKAYTFYKIESSFTVFYFYNSAFHMHFIIEDRSAFFPRADTGYYKACRYTDATKRYLSFTGKVRGLDKMTLLTHENPQLRKLVKRV